jgi:hypothetical protein
MFHTVITPCRDIESIACQSQVGGECSQMQSVIVWPDLIGPILIQILQFGIVLRELLY